MGEITGLCLHNLDSIFILQNHQISLLKNGKLEANWIINTTNDSMCLKTYNDNSFSYHPDTKSILMQHGCCWCETDSIEFYSTPPLPYFNLQSNELKFPKVRYSKMYLNKYYGYKNIFSFNSYRENTIVSYMIDPNIYVLNNNTGEVYTYGGKSKYQCASAKELKIRDRYNSDKKVIDIKHDFVYHGLQFDPYRNLYYRFFELELPLKNKEGKYNTTYDREIVLMVFNINYELLNEIKFPQNIFNISYATKEGLYVLKYNKNKQWKGARYYLVKFY